MSDNFIKGEDENNIFDQVAINLASPEDIRGWSQGEVTEPETMNYRTFKPEKRGLFCEQIFGPVKNHECTCGRYKRKKYKGIVCEKCNVEVTDSSVRRERMGHIELASPVVHIWFLKSLPSKISTLLDINLKDVERILYFEVNVVIDQGITNLMQGELLTDAEIEEIHKQYGEHSFVTDTGAEAIQKLLSNLDLPEVQKQLLEDLSNTNSESKRKKIIKRLKLVEDFLGSNNKPEWMVISVLPVTPADIRPLVTLDGGRFATSDLNELYRRVINRNNRLKKLIDLKAPEIIIRNEKRMLQESVDALFDNGRRGRVVKSSNKRPFKSLSDMLKGKQGRFRQNLLGKRVDYSGRSVIVVGPKLKLHQCGLPKRMALELFKPFIYGKLELYGIASTLKEAKKIVETERPEVWDILEEVIKQHPVLLNRAPTLHRLSIQAFEPLLIEGKAIQLHPLVCTAFNADFDGDQMAVHIPLSIEAQIEARVLMMSTNNILSPSNGKPIVMPDKDIVLGLYYLTLGTKSPDANKVPVMSSFEEIEHALFQNHITLHTPIKYPVKGSKSSIEPDTIVETTAGRVILYSIFPEHPRLYFQLVNTTMTKSILGSLIDMIYRNCGTKSTVIFVDKLMELGFKYSCISGISFGMDDMVVPKTKTKHIDSTLSYIKEFENQYSEGLITYGEKYNKVVDSWARCTDKITNDLMSVISNKENGEYNSIYTMYKAGARGSPAQIKQICGMRGLMSKPSGEIIETPIKSNFKEGLTVLEYFSSTHGARKGLADTALKTANAGYLTRRLVDVALDAVIREYDCGTTDGIYIESIVEGGEVTVPISEKALGRVAAIDIKNLEDNTIIIPKGHLILENDIEQLMQIGIDEIKVRSVLTCAAKTGVCSKCYGRDLASGKLVAVGEAVGVVAAQSIGEPGTQLTLRTFHIGGAATKKAEASSIEAKTNAVVKLINVKSLTNPEGKDVIISRTCEMVLLDVSSGLEKARYKVNYGANILVKNNQKVTQGQTLAQWDPYNIVTITPTDGKIILKDIVQGISLKEVLDEATGIATKTIITTPGSGLKPYILVEKEDGTVSEKLYLSPNNVLLVSDGDIVKQGTILSRLPKESSKTKDITGGLPRVAELFEARMPKDPAILAGMDGVIQFGKDYKTKRKIILNSLDGNNTMEYMIPKGKHILFNEGEVVKKGSSIVAGSLVLQDILNTMGIEELAKYMVNEVQFVYRLQGVKIDDKHIEVILKQMIQQVEIVDSGDTALINGEKLSRESVLAQNNTAINSKKKPAKYIPIVQGVTKSALQTKSFISSASFQETTKILTEAAVMGKVDNLDGLKENVIVGRLIPAGTGYYINQISNKNE